MPGWATRRPSGPTRKSHPREKHLEVLQISSAPLPLGSYLSLGDGCVDVLPSLFDTQPQLPFADTLKVLELRFCIISFRRLVALLNKFRFLDHLILYRIEMKSEGQAPPLSHPPSLSYPPKKLQLVEDECGGLKEFSGLGRAYEELSLHIYNCNNGWSAMGLRLANDSMGSLTCLDLGNILTCMCHKKPMICLWITD